MSPPVVSFPEDDLELISSDEEDFTDAPAAPAPIQKELEDLPSRSSSAAAAASIQDDEADDYDPDVLSIFPEYEIVF